jgi:hypothetical protein
MPTGRADAASSTTPLSRSIVTSGSPVSATRSPAPNSHTAPTTLYRPAGTRTRIVPAGDKWKLTA